jgi:hypothetical protein
MVQTVLLNKDLLQNIFANLTEEDLCSAAMVCNSWRAATYHEDFWRKVDLFDRKVTSTQVSVGAAGHRAVCFGVWWLHLVVKYMVIEYQHTCQTGGTRLAVAARSKGLLLATPSAHQSGKGIP